MKFRELIFRSLLHYWRTNIPVVAGVAVAVAVLSGALMVGRSVRGSLQDILFERIGSTETVIVSNRFFGEQVLESFAGSGKACPVITLQGMVIYEKGGGIAGRMQLPRVQVYGIDERFWEFQGISIDSPPDGRAALAGSALARQLGIENGGSLILQIDPPQSVPREWLYGRRDNMGKTIRLLCNAVLPKEKLGEFALRPTQGDVYSIFVPLKTLQKELGLGEKINTILLADQPDNDVARLGRLITRNLTIADLGLKISDLPSGNGFYLESSRIIIEDETAEQAMALGTRLGMTVSPVYAYLANAIRAGGRSVPYSAIAAADIGEGALSDERDILSPPDRRSDPALPPILLNEWARNDLAATPGETVEVEYYLWLEAGRLVTKTASFRFAGTVETGGTVDTTFSPEIPGITESQRMSDWDPPFPLDLKSIRDKDEDYWNRYRATPKAIVPLSTGQELWQTRFGKLTSIRFAGGKDSDPEASRERFSQALLSGISPSDAGFSIRPVKEFGLDASHGSTDFGEYFIYFSFFLIVSGVLLSVLFFRLTIEQRSREVGILEVAGFHSGLLRRLFLWEGAVLSVAGSVFGAFLSLLYGWLMIYGLRTWWIGAVGTTSLTLHFTWQDLASGAAGVVCVSLATIFWTLRALRKVSPRSMLKGSIDPPEIHLRKTRVSGWAALTAAVAAALLLCAALLQMVTQTMGFFTAGFLLMICVLAAISFFLRRSRPGTLRGHGWRALLKLGMRHAGYRPGRSLLCAALIASATFIIVSTEAFHRDPDTISLQKNSGTGGYPFVAESTLAVVYDLNSTEGREALGIEPPQSLDPDSLRFVSFRERPGDDTSCLNLYTPSEPRIFGVPETFIQSGRFSFGTSLAETEEQRQNPWKLLDRDYPDGAVAAIADANTIQYILHLSLGSDLPVRADNGAEIRLRLVAALEDSIFQGGLLISESNFLKLFPDRDGYRFFLVDMPPVEDVSALQPLKESLGNWSIQLYSSRELLSSYHRVENTYLSTFQSLGTLGLVLGTLGLATVLLRNVLERRSELALLRATGYPKSALAVIVLGENMLLLLWGVGAGILCAVIAIAPAIHSRGSSLPLSIVGSVMGPVLITGIIASLVAVAAVFRSPLLQSLRSE